MTTLGSGAHADTRDHVDVRGPGYHQKNHVEVHNPPLLLTVKGKEATFAVVPMTADAAEERRIENKHYCCWSLLQNPEKLFCPMTEGDVTHS